MTVTEILAFFLQFLMPVVLIARVAFARKRTQLSGALNITLAASYLAAITFAVPWLALPWYLPWGFIGLLVVAAGVNVRRAPLEGNSPRGSVARVGLGLAAVLVIVFLGVALFALKGRQRFDGPTVELAFPLSAGTYLVANGGSNILVNFHLKTQSGERYQAFRGQSYAVDVVKVGTWGTRTSHLSPNDPSGFAIFGDPIQAPCSGEVVRAVDGDPDRLPPGEAPATLEGNHVILTCDGIWVVLAHIMQGSVRVAEGSDVTVGDLLGLVGNSGASDEPHLHVHAQTPGSWEALLGGAPVPVTFDGRHLVRNDRIRTN